MSVPPIQMAAIDWAAAAAGTMAPSWRVGSVVSGRVLELFDQGTRLILQINGQTVEAQSPSNGLPPHNFQARVVGGGAQPVLELLSSPARSTPTAALLRARLPSQGGLQPLLSDLQAMANTSSVRALPESVRTALARLEASITDRHDLLDPEVLRDSVQRAGLQLEHNLAMHAGTATRLPATQIDYDMKAVLQRLGEALRQLPQSQPPTDADADARLPLPHSANAQSYSATQGPLSQTAPAPRQAQLARALQAALPPRAAAETPPPLHDLPLQPQPRLPLPLNTDALMLASGMLKHVEGALSRIEIMQLEAHPSASPQACMIEVPVRSDDGFDVLQLRIEPDAAGIGADAAPLRWTLGFTLEPPSLGAIHGRIRLRGTQVDVDLWAQHDAAVQALEEQTTVLAQLLEGSGLELAQLRVSCGAPQRHTGLSRRLLEASA